MCQVKDALLMVLHKTLRSRARRSPSGFFFQWWIPWSAVTNGYLSSGFGLVESNRRVDVEYQQVLGSSPPPNIVLHYNNGDRCPKVLAFITLKLFSSY